MKILGIETSCDETAIAVVEVKDHQFFVLSNIISSQAKVHQKWGGVVPSLAKREHQKNLTPVLKMALDEAKMLQKLEGKNEKVRIEAKDPQLKEILEKEKNLYRRLITFLGQYHKPKVDYIAVTVGLGLEPALWAGVNFAKALALFWQKPIVPVNHIEAHLLANFLNYSPSELRYPAICLTVSGGHTMLVLMEGIGRYKTIGETRDDSAGECFDKTARLLGLGYPGGPAIAAASAKSQIPDPKSQTSSKFQVPNSKIKIILPRPMIYSKDYDFSFSGLKTAVLYHYQSQLPRVRKSKNYVFAMAAEIQQAIADVLIAKTLRAAKNYKVKTVMIGGGVAANSELRKQLRERTKKDLPGVVYIAPDPKLCTDNGVMAAVAGYFNWQNGRKTSWQNVKADANIKI